MYSSCHKEHYGIQFLLLFKAKLHISIELCKFSSQIHLTLSFILHCMHTACSTTYVGFLQILSWCDVFIVRSASIEKNKF